MQLVLDSVGSTPWHEVHHQPSILRALLGGPSLAFLSLAFDSLHQYTTEAIPWNLTVPKSKLFSLREA